MKKLVTKRKIQSFPIRAKRSSAKVKEDISRNNLKNLLSPWMCTTASSESGEDIGIDYYVHLVNNSLDNADLNSDDSYLLLQLKAQTKLKTANDQIKPFPVETKKIIQWYNSSRQLPFLFVVNDLDKNSFYYQWIDDSFISNLEKTNSTWTNQQTVQLSISKKQEITKQTRDTILREYVLNYKCSSGKIIEPGVFFQMNSKVKEMVKKYETITQDFGFQSINQNIQMLKENAENAIYRVVIAGLSRVGKSSLINTLLHRPDISPADVWQTTGVPIIVHPGEEEKIMIHFLDGKEPIESVYNADVIREYVTRTNNEDNFKKVRDVTICITSKQLERGVMFYDIPGLNDPNDEILAFAYQTTGLANVILYVIDGSTADGSFVFSGEYKRHIQNFSTSKKDKIFLIINKVDKLSKELLNDLKKEIERNLEKYNLKGKLSSKIYYLAVDPKDKTKINNLKTEINTVEELEEDLWKYILDENKLGLFKLQGIIRDLLNSIKDFEQILQARLLDVKDKETLEKTMNNITQRIPSLAQYIKEQKNKISYAINSHIDLKKNTILENLENYLEGIPIKDKLPSRDVIQKYLTSNAFETIKSTQETYGLEVKHLNKYIETWVEDNLKQIRELINYQTSQPNIPSANIENIYIPDIDYSAMWGKGLFAIIIGSLIDPVIGIGLAIGYIFIDWILGLEHRRAKQISKICSSAKAAYNKAFADAKFKFDGAVKNQVDNTINHVNNRLKFYFNDLNSRISQIKLNPSIDYVKMEKQIQEEFHELRDTSSKLWEELHPYLYLVKPIEIE